MLFSSSRQRRVSGKVRHFHSYISVIKIVTLLIFIILYGFYLLLLLSCHDFFSPLERFPSRSHCVEFCSNWQKDRCILYSAKIFLHTQSCRKFLSVCIILHNCLQKLLCTKLFCRKSGKISTRKNCSNF